VSEGTPGPSGAQERTALPSPPTDETPEAEPVAPDADGGREPGGVVGTDKLVVPRWIQLVALPLLVLALWGVALAAGPVLLIFTVAGVLALILDPMVRAIQRARVPRGLAVAIVYLGFWGAVAGGGVLLADPIANQVDEFRANVPDYIDSASRGLEDLQRWLDERGIDLQVQTAGEDAFSELERDLLQRSGDLVGWTRDVLEVLVTGIFALVLVIVISVYMLLYGRTIGDLARRVMPPSEDDFPTRVVHAVARYVGGQLAFSAIMGTSAGIALWTFGALGIFPDGRTFAVFFGIFYGLMELIPYVGPVLGATPPVAIALFQDPLTAVWLVLLFVALQQAEGHVVAPLVFGRALRINPLLVIFALLFGGHLYGVIGALVALPVTAMLRETIMYLRENLRLEPWPVAGRGEAAGLLQGQPSVSCSACGERLPAGDQYCRKCGEVLTHPGAGPRRDRQ
jgi:predicted PurR-regulated permease PerM